MMIAKVNETKLLTYTSILFLLPSYYAFINNHILMFIIAGLTSIISYNYWSYPLKNGYNRYFDLIYSKFSFTIFFYNGVVHVQYPECFIAYFILSLIIYNYKKACMMYNLNKKCWIYFHALFHIFVMINQLFIIHHM